MGQEDCDDSNLLLWEIHDRLLRKNDKAAISAIFPRAFLTKAKSEVPVT